MFRYIMNKSAGRKKVVEESLGRAGIYSLVLGLDPKTEINIAWNIHGRNDEATKVTPSRVIRIMDIYFNPIGQFSPMRYFEARHQVFQKMSDERHYVDFQEGELTIDNGKEIKMPTDKKGTLEFVVERKVVSNVLLAPGY